MGSSSVSNLGRVTEVTLPTTTTTRAAAVAAAAAAAAEKREIYAGRRLAVSQSASQSGGSRAQKLGKTSIASCAVSDGGATDRADDCERCREDKWVRRRRGGKCCLAAIPKRKAHRTAYEEEEEEGG